MIQNKIISVIGHKGYGKTTLCNIIALSFNLPTIIIDPRHQFKESKHRVFLKSSSEFYLWLQKNYRIFRSGKIEIVLNIYSIDEFNECSKLVYKMKNILFVIDEVDLFLNNINKNDELYKIIHYGRHNKINLLTTSRRPANISRDLTSQTDIFYCARIREPNDLKYFKVLFGNEEIEKIKNLEKFSFFCADDEKMSIYQLQKNDFDILERNSL